jgi:outer membrane receptor for ferrienterochelin and colicins
MNRYSSIFLLFTSIFFVEKIKAQIDSLPTAKLLEEFIFTGNYKPTGIDKSVMLTRNINIEKLQAMGVQNVGDALKFQTNMRLQQDNILGTALSMQGLSGENVKILIDGVPQTGRQNGNIDLSQLNLVNVERIEIVEGPLSVQYGTNALAGTINIITKKKPVKPLDFQVNTYVESVGHINVNASAGLKFEEHSLMMSGGRNFFDGWSDVDTSRYKQWKPKIQYFGDVRYGFTKDKTTIGVAGSYFDEYILNRGRPILPKSENAFDDTYKTQRYNTSFNWSQSFDNQWNTNFIIAYNKYARTKNSYYRDLVNLGQILTENSGDQDTTQFNLFTSRATLAKTESKRLNYELGFDGNLEVGKGLRLKDSKQQIGDYALFASAEWKIKEGFTLRPGVRFAYNTSYKAPVIPSLHARWQLNEAWTLRASYGRGFRAPSLKELYFYFVDINHNIQGNENLLAERSHNISVSSTFKKVVGNTIYKVDVSAFNNIIENQITLAILRGQENAYGYINIGNLKTQGGQAYGEVVVNHLTFGVGASLINSINKFENQSFEAATYEVRSNVVYNIPRIGLDINVWFKHNGRQNGFVLNEEGKIMPTYISAFSMADLSFGKKMFEGKLGFSAGIKNLFNVKNIDSQLVSGSHGGGNGFSPVGTGKIFFIKCVINL